MDRTLMAAITAAVEAYIASERAPIQRGTTQPLNRWKMAARRETAVIRRALTIRADPHRIRLGRYSLL